MTNYIVSSIICVTRQRLVTRVMPLQAKAKQSPTLGLLRFARNDKLYCFLDYMRYQAEASNESNAITSESEAIANSGIASLRSQ